MGQVGRGLESNIISLLAEVGLAVAVALASIVSMTEIDKGVACLPRT